MTTIAIPCPYCRAPVHVVSPTMETGETRAGCAACGARVGVDLHIFRRGQPKAARDNAKAAKGLVGRQVQVQSGPHAGKVGTVRWNAGSTCGVAFSEESFARLPVTILSAMQQQEAAQCPPRP